LYSVTLKNFSHPPLNTCNIALIVITHVSLQTNCGGVLKTHFSLLFLWPMGGKIAPPPLGYSTGHHIYQCRLNMSAQLNHKSRKIILSLWYVTLKDHFLL